MSPIVIKFSDSQNRLNMLVVFFNAKSQLFQVIDEADRMMKEFKFDWVLKVEHAVFEDAPSVCRHAAGLTPTAG